MTINDLITKLDAKTVVLGNGNREISTGYCGDFLSFVIGRAPKDCAWFTVMTNVNVAAVAHLAEVAVVVLCEDCSPDENLINRAKTQNINLIVTKHDIFSAVLKVFDAH
jgi:hypothetical protein